MDDQQRRKSLMRRTFVLSGLQLAGFGLLGARMFQLQVLEKDRYAVLADQNRIRVRPLAPERGKLLDRQGVPLAVNAQTFAAMVVPEEVGDLEALLDKLGRHIAIAPHERDAALAKARTQARYLPIEVSKGLSWPDVARVEVNRVDLPGVSIEERDQRYYPLGPTVAHVTGYLGEPANTDREVEAQAANAGVLVGKLGAEHALEAQLQGTAGVQQVEVSASGRPVRELARIPSTPGRVIRLSIDSALQRYLMDRTAGERSAAAVVMDIHTGEVLAMASQPSYDPNLLSDGISHEEWAAFGANPDAPMLNKAIAGQYAPGSTFKMAVLLAALESGAITTAHKVHCPGVLKLGNARFHCWKRQGHGTVDVRNSLKWSCDVFYYDIALRAGIEAITAMGRRLGLGVDLGLGLRGEQDGFLPTEAWKQAEFGDRWQKGETVIAGIGQGYVTATALQLATMTARLANGGRPVTPTLDLGGSIVASAPDAERVAAPAHLALVADAMRAVVNENDGTAYAARIPDPGLAMAGKTGTAQVRRISLAERRSGVRSNDDLDWRLRDHALFVGFAPVDSPRFAAAIVVEHGGSGSGTAAPIGRDVLAEAQKLMPPDPPHHHLIAGLGKNVRGG